jgi:hypothetical protein
MLLGLERLNVGALVFPVAGALVRRRFGETHPAGRGRRTCADGQGGFHRNLGDPVVSILKRGSKGMPLQNRLARQPVPGPARDTKLPAQRMVSPSEGNEARRDGRQEVVVP